jgi:transposase-like protein
MIGLKGRHFQQEMIHQYVRCYLVYSLSYRKIEKIMKERGFEVDHSTLQRWVIHYAPKHEARLPIEEKTCR